MQKDAEGRPITYPTRGSSSLWRPPERAPPKDGRTETDIPPREVVDAEASLTPKRAATKPGTEDRGQRTLKYYAYASHSDEQPEHPKKRLRVKKSPPPDDPCCRCLYDDYPLATEELSTSAPPYQPTIAAGDDTGPEALATDDDDAEGPANASADDIYPPASQTSLNGVASPGDASTPGPDRRHDEKELLDDEIYYALSDVIMQPAEPEEEEEEEGQPEDFEGEEEEGHEEEEEGEEEDYNEEGEEEDYEDEEDPDADTPEQDPQRVDAGRAEPPEGRCRSRSPGRGHHEKDMGEQEGEPPRAGSPRPRRQKVERTDDMGEQRPQGPAHGIPAPGLSDRGKRSSPCVETRSGDASRKRHETPSPRTTSARATDDKASGPEPRTPFSPPQEVVEPASGGARHAQPSGETGVSPDQEEWKPKDASDLLNELENESKASWATMKLRIAGKKDPAIDAKAELLGQARMCWSKVTGRPEQDVAPEALADALNQLDPEALQTFHSEWCRCCYQTEAVLKAFDMERKAPNTTLRSFMRMHAEEFYDGLLNISLTCDPLAKQRETPLCAVVPLAVAKACERVSVGQGLPADGHCVHAAFLGQAVYYMNGAEGRLPCVAVEGTESEWNVAGTKLPLILEGDSAAGGELEVPLEFERKYTNHASRQGN